MGLILVSTFGDELANLARQAGEHLVDDVRIVMPGSDVVTLDWGRAVAFFGCTSHQFPSRHTRLVTDQHKDEARGIVVPRYLKTARFVVALRKRSHGDFAEAVRFCIARCTHIHNVERQQANGSQFAKVG